MLARTRKRLRITTLGAALLSAGSLALIGENGAAADVGDAGSADARAPSPGAKIPPDPPPLVEREQWVFVLRWSKNEPYLVSVQKTDMGGPHTSPRVMGRFALELFEGPTLIERVRFNFPMLGAPETPDAGYKTPPRFEPGLTTRIGVFFPATKRGTRLELWDRATDRRWPLPWPPKPGVFSDPPAGSAAGQVRDAAAD
jgi:hypothetical protein